jgi:hypothetical protein
MHCLGRVGAEMKELRIVLAVNRVDEPQFLRGGDRLAGVILVVARDLLATGLGEVSGVDAGTGGDDLDDRVDVGDIPSGLAVTLPDAA